MSKADTSLGIKELSRLSKILIRHQTTKKANKYVVLSPEGDAVLYARQSGILDRILVGDSRAFVMTLYDNNNKEVIKLIRHYTKKGPEKMDVKLCGKLVSVVRNEISLLRPIINVNDAIDRPAYKIKGPLVTSDDCDFKIYTREKECVGIIGRRWGGPEDANGYKLNLPRKLDVHYKAALLGTCFLIDFVYYKN